MSDEIVRVTQTDLDNAYKHGWDDALKNGTKLSKKYTGMRISASGVLNRVKGFLGFGAKEMLKHLREMATKYYAGDIAAVDEFLQLYCLDDDRLETITKGD